MISYDSAYAIIQNKAPLRMKDRHTNLLRNSPGHKGFSVAVPKNKGQRGNEKQCVRFSLALFLVGAGGFEPPTSTMSR
jgi:hypothetical protein